MPLVQCQWQWHAVHTHSSPQLRLAQCSLFTQWSKPNHRNSATIAALLPPAPMIARQVPCVAGRLPALRAILLPQSVAAATTTTTTTTAATDTTATAAATQAGRRRCANRCAGGARRGALPRRTVRPFIVAFHRRGPTTRACTTWAPGRRQRAHFMRHRSYAAPPVGALRWQPPAPAVAWKGERQAREYSASCMQPKNVRAPPVGFLNLRQSVSEHAVREG